jgi:uncharacterized cupredoxin-like copper-binding protein
MLSTLTSILLSPLAFLGGRWPQEIYGRPVNDYGQTLLIGALALVSLGITGLGQYQFFTNGLHHPKAVQITCCILLVLAVVDHCLMRTMENFKWLGRLGMYLLRLVICSVNVITATPEILIMVFDKQVAAQAVSTSHAAFSSVKQSNAQKFDIQGGNDAVQRAKSIVDDLQKNKNNLTHDLQLKDKDLNGCWAKRNELQQIASNTQDEGSKAKAERAVAAQSNKCSELNNTRSALKAQETDAINQLNAASAESTATSAKLQKSMQQMQQATEVEGKLLVEGETTGFARHNLLHEAVRQGKVPLTAAWGLSLMIGILEVLGLLIKVMARPDAATSDRMLANAQTALEHQTKAARLELEHQTETALITQMQDSLKAVVNLQRPAINDQLASYLTDVKLEELALRLHTQSAQAASAHLKAYQRSGAAITPSMLQRLKNLFNNVGLKRQSQSPRSMASAGMAVI